jgi:RNA polymerase sigma-70 factor, ECF subfamily
VTSQACRAEDARRGSITSRASSCGSGTGVVLKGGRGEINIDTDVTAKEAFLREVYAEHGVALKFFIMRLNAGDQHSAEDTAQETMIRAWASADSLRGSDRPIRPWLFTVARRLVIDAKRHRDARPHEVEYSSAAGADRSLEEGFEAVHTKDEVVRALRSLTPAQREIIFYIHYLGMPVAEVAQELGIPAGTVKSRTYYVLRMLRTRLAAESLMA